MLRSNQRPEPTQSPLSLASPASSASGAAASAAAEPPPKPHFPPPAELPTQLGPDGLRFDFNFGARVALPEGGGPRRIKLSDLDTGNVLYGTTVPKGWVHSAKQYYIRVRIEAFVGDRLVFSHDYDCRDKEVLVQLPVGTLGDSLGWLPYAAKFQRAHGCRLSVALAEFLIPLFRDAYPEIEFLTHEQVDPKRYYATYNIGLFFDDDERVHQPCDFRLVGLHRTAGYILGVDPTEEPPRITPSSSDRPIAERYVCIAAQSTTQAKYWNNPFGWREIIRFLTDAGYRVVCIDRSPANGQGLIWESYAPRRAGRDGEPPAHRASALAHVRGFLRWPVERPCLAGVGGRRPGSHDQRLHPPGERVHDPLSRDQLPHLQQLLE
jgi:autotransporter strand-loop-strand O-heptosyltransferase